MAEAPRRGRPPRLTRDDIASAVLEVGFAGLTFGAVRERLGVSESTLYRHAPDRDELVRIGLERALTGVTWPGLEGPWRDILRAYGHAAWHALAAYPGSATEVARGVVPAAMAGLFDGVGGALMAAGFSAEHAVLAGDLVFDLATDNRRGVEHLDALVPTAGPGRGVVGEHWQAGTAEQRAANRNGDAPDAAHSAAHSAASRATSSAALNDGVQAAIVADPVEWFSAKLDVVLAGIEATLAPRRSA